MSTLMSTDMNISRPTSRVSRPPGGATTIAFGNERDEPLPPPAPTPEKKAAASVMPPSPAPAPTPASMKSPGPEVKDMNTKGKVGILVGGHFEHDAIALAVTKALAKLGIRGGVMSQTDDIATLPFAAQNMCKHCDVLIVCGILQDPSGTVAPSLSSALMTLALNGRTPIVPGFVVKSTLLEAKGMLGHDAEMWAKSAANALHLTNGGTLSVDKAPEVEEEPELTPELDSVEDLLKIFRTSLKQHGARGIHGLQRKFKIADDDGNKKLDLGEFKKMISEHALGWTPEQIKCVFDKFDADKSGDIDFNEFLLTVKGDMNERRIQLVLLAFDILDANKNGTVELDDIVEKYDASKHPDVLAGKRSESSVLAEFLDTFDTIEKDGKVTPQEFIKYYSNVSASIDADDYFELMMRNAWHISGGEGWCANSSNRRVLVVHNGGRATVEEIKNDMGINANDLDKMYNNLVGQGITDIDYIELTDGTRYKDGKAVAPTGKAAPAVVAAPAAPAAAAANRRRAPGGASTISFG